LPKNTLGEGTYTAKHIIVATGARPRALPGIEPDGKLIWTYFEAMKPEKMPKSLLVMGSGAIGIEFASFYRTMGVDVTVVEVMKTVMPVEDAEISAFAKKQFDKQGMKILLEAKVTKVEKGADSVTAHVELKDGKVEKITADRMISAVGVQGNIENIGLEALGVKTDRGCIVIDGYGKTNVPGIYAIGDVAGPPMLAHKAEHEAVICVEKIAGLPNVHPMDKLKIPGCTYCNPQVASVGLTEAKAKEQGRDIRVGRFPFVANGKAIALGEDQGMVKTIFDKKTGEVARRPSGRRRSHRTDPGFRGGDEPGNHRGRPDAHDLPASDHFRDAQGKRARRLWTGAERVIRRLCRAWFFLGTRRRGSGRTWRLGRLVGRGAVELGAVRLEGMAGIACGFGHPGIDGADARPYLVVDHAHLALSRQWTTGVVMMESRWDLWRCPAWAFSGCC
jgi:hypothetical protein